MFFLISLIPATLAVVLGYFVLFSSTKSQGAMRTFGQIVAIWVFALAVASPIAGAYGTYAGFSPVTAMQSMHSGGKF
jgi:hypothetical protein